MNTSKPSLFEQLKAACTQDWTRYIEHEFVRQLGDGSLPKKCFQHYLKQDYLFLIQFARAYGLAVYKSDNLEEMRQAQAGLGGLLDTEMALHIDFCAEWGISPAELATLPEATATLAYTRYVLERGVAGSLMDLHTALAPCILGYAEVGQWLLEQPGTHLEGNPYRAWIDLYQGDEYRAVARSEREQLDALAFKETGSREMGDQRFKQLAKTFGEATRLEIAFWDMGLNLAT
jgi:thiaminase/transcriptional activator TenA